MAQNTMNHLKVYKRKLKEEVTECSMFHCLAQERIIPERIQEADRKDGRSDEKGWVRVFTEAYYKRASTNEWLLKNAQASALRALCRIDNF